MFLFPPVWHSAGPFNLWSFISYSGNLAPELLQHSILFYLSSLLESCYLTVSTYTLLRAYAVFLIYECFPSSLWYTSLHWSFNSLASSLSVPIYKLCLLLLLLVFQSSYFCFLLNIICWFYFYGQRHVSFCVFVMLILRSYSSSTFLPPVVHVAWALLLFLRWPCSLSVLVPWFVSARSLVVPTPPLMARCGEAALGPGWPPRQWPRALGDLEGQM